MSQIEFDKINSRDEIDREKAKGYRDSPRGDLYIFLFLFFLLQRAMQRAAEKPAPKYKIILVLKLCIPLQKGKV